MKQRRAAGGGGSRAPGPGLAKRWITALALLAFFLQGLAVQTHVHQYFQPGAVQAEAGSTHKLPLKTDPVDQCRLCQELLHAGHFVAPSALVVFAGLSLAAAIFAAVPILPDHSARAFSWNSRAPPRR